MASGFPLSMNVGDPVSRAKAKPPPAPKPPAPQAEDTSKTQADALARREAFMAPYEKEFKEAVEAQQQFESAQKEDVAIREAARARARGAALETEKAAIESSPAMQRLTEVERAMETPFVPTKDNATDLATLYSLIGVVGFAIGAGGKGNAMAAMSAMNGMAQGYQQGRMDLYTKEKDQFDTNMKQLKTRAETLSKELERITKLAAYDRQKAEYEADAVFAEQGATFLKDYKAKYGFPKALELAKRSADNANETFKYIIKLEDDAARRREQREQRRSDLEYQRQTQLLVKGLTGDRKPLGSLPKDKETRNSYAARYQTIKNIEDIESLLDDPKYSRLITPATKFTPAIIDNLRENFPELSQKLARVQAIEFEKGGKNLTANEIKILEPLYGWKGLTASALKTRIRGVKEDFELRNQMEESYYPGLANIRTNWDSIYANSKSPTLPAIQTPETQDKNISQEAERRFGKYEPEKYNYGYENGRFYREAK